jgi:hypothetical protein
LAKAGLPAVNFAWGQSAQSVYLARGQPLEKQSTFKSDWFAVPMRTASASAMVVFGEPGIIALRGQCSGWAQSHVPD